MTLGRWLPDPVALGPFAFGAPGNRLARLPDEVLMARIRSIIERALEEVADPLAPSLPEEFRRGLRRALRAFPDIAEGLTPLQTVRLAEEYRCAACGEETPHWPPAPGRRPLCLLCGSLDELEHMANQLRRQLAEARFTQEARERTEARLAEIEENITTETRRLEAWNSNS